MITLEQVNMAYKEYSDIYPRDEIYIPDSLYIQKIKDIDTNKEFFILEFTNYAIDTATLWIEDKESIIDILNAKSQEELNELLHIENWDKSWTEEG